MPSRTRPNQRVIEMQYEEALNIPLPATPKMEQAERLPLGELSVQNEQIPIMIDLNVKPTKSNRKKKNNKENLPKSEVIEDDYESSSSSAVDEVRRELRRSGQNNIFNIYLDSRPQTPISKAAKAARKELSPASPTKTPKVDSGAHDMTSSAKHIAQGKTCVMRFRPHSPISMHVESIEVVEDDLVASPSAAAILTPTTINKTISPKRSPRIEDSVAAIDALSDVLEEMEACLPIVLSEDKLKPLKAVSVSPTPKTSANTTKKRVASAPVPKKAATVSCQIKNLTLVNAKPPNTTSTSPKRQSTASAMTQQRSPVVPAKAITKPTVTVKAPVPRVASVTRAPFTPVKSTRVLTKPNFTLPGDAITARKKAAHEAKLKREEEERKAKRAFKARPIPARSSLGVAVVPRSTIASQKRKSFIKGVDQTIETVAKPVVKKVEIPRSTSDPGAQKSRTNQIRASVPSRLSSSAVKSNTTSSIVGAKAPAVIKTTPVKKVTVPLNVSTTPKGSPLNNTKTLSPQEKAQATKKARAEAAERSRQASREWAEKQKKKRESLAATNVINSDES